MKPQTIRQPSLIRVPRGYVAAARKGWSRNDQIAKVLTLGGVKFVREYRFHPHRQWRFDFAFPDHMVALEFQGGQYAIGAHQRPIRFGQDCEKLRNAAILGWRVLLYSASDLNKNKVFNIIGDLQAAGVAINKTK